jgi:hypothetical protein
MKVDRAFPAFRFSKATESPMTGTLFIIFGHKSRCQGDVFMHICLGSRAVARWKHALDTKVDWHFEDYSTDGA